MDAINYQELVRWTLPICEPWCWNILSTFARTKSQKKTIHIIHGAYETEILVQGWNRSTFGSGKITYAYWNLWTTSAGLPPNATFRATFTVKHSNLALQEGPHRSCLVVYLPLWKYESVGMLFHSQLFLESHNPFHGSSHHQEVMAIL